MATLNYVDQDAPEQNAEMVGDVLPMLRRAFELTQDDNPHHTVHPNGSHSWLYCDGGTDVEVAASKSEMSGGS